MVQTGPVSWEIAVPKPLISHSEKASAIDLFTYLHVRENSMELFGFDTYEQRHLFKLLIDISGVGPKSALGILSQAVVDEIKKAVQTNNTLVFTSVSGIGQKGANRIILELKSKLEKDDSFDISQLTEDKETSNVIAALVGLGYTKNEARRAVREADPKLGLQEKVRACLKILGRA